MLDNAFLNLRWHMNRRGLSAVVAAINAVLFFTLRPFVRERFYADPDNMRYLSSLSVPVVGFLAFRKLDGTLQFRW